MQFSKNAPPTTCLTESEACGADRDRTDDIQLAKLALSQLSYSPSWMGSLDRGARVVQPAKWA